MSLEFTFQAFEFSEPLYRLLLSHPLVYNVCLWLVGCLLFAVEIVVILLRFGINFSAEDSTEESHGNPIQWGKKFIMKKNQCLEYLLQLDLSWIVGQIAIENWVLAGRLE
jgi:hypothetical protein